MRAVLDSNVLVAGLRSRLGVSYQILKALPERTFTPLISVPLLLEYEDVLKRQVHRRAAQLTEADIDIVLDMIAAVSEHVTPHYLWRPLLADSGDDMVLEVAVTGSADAIVTFNTRDFGPVKSGFDIDVLEPRLFWPRLPRQQI